ncbi:MAG TPA: LysM domain-containing protein [Terriglobales bacterium]|nr:LysM domain-containing protein [Terriglobales bacterium]
MRTLTTRVGLASMAMAFALAGCGPAPQRASAGTFAPPPPLALVAIVDPTPDQAVAELRQLASVIQAGATPSQALVVSLIATAAAPLTYVVRAGDSLSAIAAAEGVPLATLLGANPQLGPLANRDWNRVYPGDRVTVPTGGGGSPARLAIVTRAPAGPAAPSLVAAPTRPTNATTFQDAQYRRALADATETNGQRVAAWRAEAARDVAPWQAQVLKQLDDLARGIAAAPADTVDGEDVIASVQAAANTLAGLPGRRVLLVLAGGRVGGAGAPLPGASLARIHLVVANLPPSAGTSFTAAAAAAGAAVTPLDPALTELQLPAAVNG